jgi:hypothetical protein
MQFHSGIYFEYILCKSANCQAAAIYLALAAEGAKVAWADIDMAGSRETADRINRSGAQQFLSNAMSAPMPQPGMWWNM